MFSSMISYRAEVQPDSPALIASSETLSYRDLDARVNKAAALLAPMLQSPSQVVGVTLNNPQREWTILLALARLGHATFRVSRPEEADLVEHDMDLVGPGSGLEDRPNTLVLTDKWWWGLRDGEAERIPEAAGWDDVARIILSSGTTGRPKRVALTHRQLFDRASRIAMSQSTGVGVGPASRLLVTLGTISLMGFTAPLRTWASGGAVIAREDVAGNLKNIKDLGVTGILASTHQLASLVDSVPVGFEPLVDLTVTVGGSVLTHTLMNRARQLLTPNIIVAYGSTEAGSVCNAPAHLIDTENNEVGVKLPWVELEIVDEAGMPLPPDEEGQVRIKGPDLVDGYLDDPETTAAAFKDGWFYPGDIGSLSAAGVLRIVGRSTDVVNLGGVKFAPDILENKLKDTYGVADAGSFSMQSDRGIDEVHLVIVRGPNFDLETTKAVVRQHAKVAALRVHFASEIPRNQMGKVDRALLRQAIMSK